MQLTLQAVYEEGVLRLTQPVELPNGTRVSVVITTSEVVPASESAEILASIASLPIGSSDDEFSNRDHDQQLYSRERNS